MFQDTFQLGMGRSCTSSCNVVHLTRLGDDKMAMSFLAPATLFLDWHTNEFCQECFGTTAANGQL